MGEKFNISNLNLYYGDFHALKDVPNIRRSKAGSATASI